MPPLWIDCSDVKRPTFAALVNDAIVNVDNGRLAAAQASQQEDSEGWLDIDEASVNAIIRSRRSTEVPTVAQHEHSHGPNRKTSVPNTFDIDASEEEANLVKSEAARLRSLARKVDDFVHGGGDLEGARFNE